MQGKTFQYEVRGVVPFPLDMLRYDGCWPARSVDTTAIADSLAQVATAEQVVRLEGIKRPTIDRWRSFGWAVKEL